MTYNHNKKVGKKLIAKARQKDLVHYLRARHPKSVQFASHPDAPDKFCWRGTVHDSITFFTSDHEGIDLWKYYRWSNRESGDGIDYLMKYEGYSFPNAVKTLAYFSDPFTDEEEASSAIPDPITEKENSKVPERSNSIYPHRADKPFQQTEHDCMGTVGTPTRLTPFDPSKFPDFDPYVIPDGVDEED